MKDVTVPKEWRGELRNRQSPEYTEATIRDYVIAHPDEVIKGSVFEEITGLSTARHYVQRMVKEGKLIRRQAPPNGTRGHQYTYEWYAIRPRPAQQSVPKPVQAGLSVAMLTEAIIQYTEKGGADDAAALFRFRNHLVQEEGKKKPAAWGEYIGGKHGN